MRIASLLPSATEIACALGAREDLVGVSHECDYPAGVADLPHLTGSILAHGLSTAEIDAAVKAASMERRPIYTVDGALMSSLKPDVILTQGVCAVCAVTDETVAHSLKLLPDELATHAPVLSLSGTCYAGVQRDIRQVGEAIGRQAEAEALCAEMDRRWAELAAAAPSGDAPKVLMLEWPDPPWSGGHWVPEQVRVVGGDPLFSEDGANSRRLSWDEIEAADPDIIVGMACGYDLPRNSAEVSALLQRPRFAALRAVREGRLWAADGNAYFSRPGPRIVGGAELLAGILRDDATVPGAERLSR